jgi:DNA-directed RNA polymerase specialized sigma24 family protein
VLFKSSSDSLDRILQLYGDLIYDLCESALWDSTSAQVACRMILKTLRREQPSHAFEQNERAWVIQVTCERILALAPRHGRKLTPSEQLKLDSDPHQDSRLRQIPVYFHRLGTEEQLLMLLRDKYGLPYPEIASALGIPEATLKLRRGQALRALEDWVWSN